MIYGDDMAMMMRQQSPEKVPKTFVFPPQKKKAPPPEGALVTSMCSQYNKRCSSRI
jgi:hypothetical protein